MLRHVDLCSGIGGFALGFEWAGLSKPVLFCDIEPWSRQILAQHWPDVPIAEDVKELANDARRLVPDCDILTAGYPCQPFSVAGKQKGTEDDRHIWPYIRKIIASKRPAWCVFENVYGHIALGLDEVLLDLEAEGYATRTFIVPACGVDAPHRRDRLWIVGHTEDNGRNGRSEAAGREGQTHQQVEQSCLRSELSRPNEDVAYTDSAGRQQGDKEMARQSPEQSDSSGVQSGKNTLAYANNEGPQGRVHRWQDSGWESELGHAGCSSSTHGQSEQNKWKTEPNVGRVAHGVSKRVDRIKGLGNAIVPQIAQRIGETIKVMADD
jgi:DNA (cytosine-5)-methyltransferase 1